MSKILVSVDGSENSRKAVKKAIKLANLAGSEVVLLHVANNTMNNPYITIREHKEAIDDAFSEQGKIILEEAMDLFRGEDIEVKTKLRYGEPGKNIIEEAEEGKYDLIIMGSRGLNAVSRMMLGSVSNKVLNHVCVSVLIVK